ncbi:MAG: ribonuclease Y [Candidatus Zambryskibacteria bacterium RIFCSPHIGHO2_12_FULL_38_34]|uniref:Ribonuclease Y n=1 Tax=Candidatus Zambryskibacteria bacterium RIFCSPLOWO2_12_FULL_39_16 TaxID=1802775 RepID=A0A1G2URS4_9BACT|nr:MAG: ribonuclease Y [Candidatus Zambryskibacteria bacterium RIFCSPHIGHO2_02_FULL_38_22]OHA98388.1 MAG: ribonuclease Y [Candidatus Zambryskibacteria bacterium RIFCSPHIGHO2_12_FULL_38_34]OHB08005.1 MAG: ribonuclease Y [Candidatus Zambryskibacteria bacterium RIFCSPLOWO2_02_FULL_38_13]OHB12069.1 MAG: ribonuclease Y [Candidatus Zambryskibacteria bacterium RIFCSPLOWO2_12_FULL_39_16]
MSLKIAMLFAGLAAFVGVGFGYFLRWIISLGQRGSVELRIKQMELHAREEAKKITGEAQNKAEETLKETRIEFKEKEEKIKKTEDRLIKKEEFLDKRQLDIDKEIEQVKEKVSEVKSIKEKVESLEKQKFNELQKVSKLTEEEAKNVLLKEIEQKYEEDIVVRMQKLENTGLEKIESKAKEILATSIQRLANSVSSEAFSTTVTIPSDEIKGKIIGKEGRNIKAFERVSGVEIIVDDTPGLITISSYDSVRRQVARVALENLIADGRIQPAKIEEMVEKAKQEINQIIKAEGEAAAYECGVFNLDPRIVSILGRLHFRTSYGQNVLRHSIEMSHIAGMLATEIGANVAVAKAGALLHDIGKAVDHEIAGTHVEIGRRILQKFGADEKIIRAMESHHGEYPYSTLESYIVQSADAISGARPGARRDSVENYLKRLTELEAIATSFIGVEKAYALQAGRELRIFVTPSQINDLEAKDMARNIAVRIENELKYPGEIRVVVIRESRTIEFAR